MPFDTSQNGGPDPALAPAVAVRARQRSQPLVGGVDRKVALLALAVAAALIAGLAWNLVKTQEQARGSLDDAIQRRAGLTADVISSALVSSRPPAGRASSSAAIPRRCAARVQKPSVMRDAQRLTVLDAEGRVLASAGSRGGPEPHRALQRRARPAREDVPLGHLPRRPRRELVELAVPYPSASGRRVLLVASPISLVESFTRGFFATPSAFRATEGYLIDGSGRTLSATRRGARVDGPVLAAVTRGDVGKLGDRTLVSGRVPSSSLEGRAQRPRFRALRLGRRRDVPARRGSSSRPSWRRSAPLLALGLMAARGARRLAAANRVADAASELAHQRLHDPLTGLANRALFAARAEQAVVAARRRGRSIAVVFMDIDHYKLINDSLGHEVGDEVLREVARRLTRSVRDADTVSRFGGDEFVVLCDDLPDGAGRAPGRRAHPGRSGRPGGRG